MRQIFFNNKINDLIVSSSNNYEENKNKSNTNECKLKSQISLGLIIILEKKCIIQQYINLLTQVNHKKYCINNRNILNNLIKTARKTYNKKQIELAGNNSKKVGELIKIASNTKFNTQTNIN